MSDATIVSSFDPDDDRGERGSALDRFARAGDDRARAPAVIPAQAFNERIVGAQEVAVHRDTKRVLAEIKTLAAAAGQDWYYRFPVNNRKENRTDWIEGPSIKLANDLARLYGNCDVDVRVTDLGDSWLMYARFTDFETGFSITRPFQQRKNASKMGGDDARKLDIALQIGVSKAIRNVVVNALQTFSDFAFEEAKNGLVEKIGKALERYRGRILEGLGSQTIDVKRVEAVVGRVAKDWLAPDMARIIAMMKAVADGMATWDETFPPLAVAAAAEPEKKDTKPTIDDFAAGQTGAKDAATAERQGTEQTKTGDAPAASSGPANSNPDADPAHLPASGEAGPGDGASPSSPQASKPGPAASSKAKQAKPAEQQPAEGAAALVINGETIAAAKARGAEAFAKKMSRRAIPGEFRAEGAEDLLQAWLTGFDEAERNADGPR